MNEKLMKKYIRKIEKKLQCSRAKRQEIQKQISADILAEVESGISFADAISEMGTPDEIAREFNANFSASEHRQYKKEKWFRRISIIAVVIVVIVLAVYWVYPKQNAIEESRYFTEDALRSQSEYIIELVADSDYDALYDSSCAKLQTAIVPENLEDIKKTFSEDWGSLKSYGNTYMTEINQMGKHSALIQMSVSFENTSVTFTISFDQDMKLSGLYMK